MVLLKVRLNLAILFNTLNYLGVTEGKTSVLRLRKHSEIETDKENGSQSNSRPAKRSLLNKSSKLSSYLYEIKKDEKTPQQIEICKNFNKLIGSKAEPKNVPGSKGTTNR